jgi:hypothetical protein
MKKYLVLPALLAMFVWSQSSYGMARILVYKGTIKASKSIVDVNDTNKLISETIKCYWVVSTYTTTFPKGSLQDSRCIIYNTKDKYYKVMPNSADLDPYDPCRVVAMSFNPSDPDGEMWFDVVGKGKLIRFPNDPNATRDYVPTTLKGTGFIDHYDFFDPTDTYSGPVTVTLVLDTKLSVPNVSVLTAGSTTPDDVVNNIVNRLTIAGGWFEWPDLTPP